MSPRRSSHVLLARGLALSLAPLGLSPALGGCSNSVLVFTAVDGAVSEQDAGPEPEVDAGRAPDADAGQAPADAQGEEAGPGPGPSEAGAEQARALAAWTHTCVADDEGTLCWGRNADGQLGIGADEAPVSRPVRLMGAVAYTQLCAAEVHSCGLRPDGAIDCWGGNSRGQLGINSRSARDFPTPVSGDLSFKWLACGGLQTCAVGKDEELYCWGHNREGQLGQDDLAGAADLLVPTPVALPRGSAQVAVGQGHACALSASGELSCWGRNDEGQLGLNSREPQIRRPTALAGSSAYMSITAGQYHSCAVRRDRRLFCWGGEFDGRLGLGPNGPDRVYEPAQVGSLSDWQRVEINWFHSCGLREGGVLMCWGRNVEGQLGVGDTATREVPAPVSGLEGVSAFTVGHLHTCASASGGTYCWGKNEFGQLGLGLGPNERVNVPTRVSLAP